MTRLGRASLGLLVGIATGCTPPAPPISPSALASAEPRPTSTSSATSRPTERPSPTAAPVEGVFGSNWDEIELGRVDADPRAAVYGDAGAVIVGANCVGPGEAPDCTAAAWHERADGSWRAASVEDAAGAIIYEVVYSDRYVALGWRREHEGDLVRALLWTSSDGENWKKAGSVGIGDCSGEGPVCGHAAGLVATAGGLVILGNVYAAGEDGFYGALVSTDARNWTRIEPATFAGDAAAYIAAAIPWEGGVVALVGSGVKPMTAWRTTDGSAWKQFSTFGDGFQSVGALATDGQQLVVTEGAIAPGGFHTTLWTAVGADQFQRAAEFDDLILSKLAYADPSGFLAVGHDEGHPQVIASPDGRSWHRTAPGLPQIECAPGWLAGGPSIALYVGNCGSVWSTREP